MWFRRKNEGGEGKVCPLCETVNPDESDSCSQCYYLLNKSSREQELPMDSGTENSLLDELLDDTLFDPNEDSTVAVDVLTIDSEAVEIDQYEVEAGGASKEDFTFLDSAGPTFAEIEVDGDGPIEESGPTLESLPSVKQSAEELEESKQEEFEFIETDAIEYDAEEADVDLLDIEDLPAVGTSVSTSNSAESIIDERTQNQQFEPQVVGNIPPPSESHTPVDDDLSPPSLDLDDIISSTEVNDDVDFVDGDPSPPPIPQSAPLSNSFSSTASNPIESSPITPTQPPLIQNGCVWPWVAGEEWEYREIYTSIMEAMEASKRGALPAAAESLDGVGPHLGERVDLIYYVGQVLRSIGREEELQAMLKSAKEKYPDDQNVTTAAYHLA